jgi:hypothetical protein
MNIDGEVRKPVFMTWFGVCAMAMLCGIGSTLKYGNMGSTALDSAL